MSEELEYGKFQGMVIERLDSLKELGSDIKKCLEKHDERIKALETTSTQAKVWATVIGALAGLLGHKLAALIPWATVTK